jgi:hypothetical protein
MRGPAAAMLAFSLCALTSGFPTIATAQSSQAPGALGDGDSIFIDGTTFRITPGTARTDPAAAIDESGARELGPGAIVFRSRGRLYIIDGPVRAPLADSATPGGVFVDADKDRTDRIRIEYVPPDNPEHQHVYELLRERMQLEMMQKLFSPFRLPVDLTIRTQGCKGQINSWYERVQSRPTVTICYEYVQYIMENSAMDDTPWGITRKDATCGQFLFVVAHEIGHALFDIFNVPVFGREEDAADQMAAYFMLHLGRKEARRLIGGASYAYLGFIKGYKDNPKVLVPLASFSSNHGSPEERFYNLLCIAYGGEPGLFADIVDKGLLPKTRAQGCKYEFKTLKYAAEREIGPHLDRVASRVAWNVAPVEQAVVAAAP